MSSLMNKPNAMLVDIQRTNRYIAVRLIGPAIRLAVSTL